MVAGTKFPAVEIADSVTGSEVNPFSVVACSVGVTAVALTVRFDTL